MPEGYYCNKCNKFVLAVRRAFKHPHYASEQTCLVCSKCGEMVYLKNQEGVIT